MESHKPRIGKKAPGPWSVGKRHAAKPKAVPQIKDKCSEDGRATTRASTCRPLTWTAEQENIIGRAPSAEARLTAAEFRLGDRSKRWEADAADTLRSARLVRSGDDSTSPSAASLWRSQKRSNVADREARGGRRSRMLITGDET